jgi:N-acetyl-gamma-glutamyl-phosphate reductase
MKPRIYVDGQEGTTGLRIHEHLAHRDDLEVLTIDPAKRKEVAERKRLLNEADVVLLCLPDVASREAVTLIEQGRTRVVDASTAFRADDGWAYGLPELSREYRGRIRTAQRVSNPGCHATAFLLGVAPLVAEGVIPPTAGLTSFSITGYSGGGKKMIAQYEAPDASMKLEAPRHYALKLAHKHLPEMQKHAGLTRPPLFTPVVCDVHSGLAVETFLPEQLLAKKASPREVHAILAKHYAGEKFVCVMPFDPQMAEGLDDGCMDITACNGTNRADIFVVGHEAGNGLPAQVAVICRLDNLGKGASGAAIQTLNLMIGAEEGTGLTV